MTAQEAAQGEIARLVARFQTLTVAQRQRFNERQSGASFIEPLFEALGWAVRNPEEVSLEVNVARERADYIFRLGGVTQFVVEAKAPHRGLSNPDFKKQAVTYAYNKGVNWTVLTNFRQLAVFNAETERQFLSLSAENFVNNFDDLWLLSKEAFASGAFERKAQAYGALQPRLPVERSLFAQLRQWREELFDQIFKHNQGLSVLQVDELIQQFLNRLIFIRAAEDRGLEENKLRAALHQWISSGHRGQLIDRLRAVFHEFAQNYDSDLFPLMDSWDAVFVDYEVLEPIIKGLYDRPGKMAGYDFSAIDADVLGAVYEQYLGHVAEVVKERARQAERQLRLLGKGEDLSYELTAKKLKRKAQGIYYTPKWVVDYIVRQTVGRFLEEHTYNENLDMKILDPACGSGSFLIRAYDELLAYHARVQGKTPAELDWAERMRILTGNIFGVDLDDQAVQIARLNLLLRALAHREILPLLRDNIRRGNSLISGTEEELRKYFGDAWREKHPFTWEQAFPGIMARGGFDVVIGNPPYAGFQGIGEDKPILRDHYSSATGRFDLYMPFIERSLQLLKERGILGFICPTNFMKRQHGVAMRQLLVAKAQIEKVVDFEHGQVFEEAINYTCILVLKKGKPEHHFLTYYPGGIDREPYMLEQSQLSNLGWVFVAPTQHGLVQRVKNGPVVALGEIAEGIYEGIVTGNNSVFVLPFSTASKLELEKPIVHPAIQGKHVERYFLEPLTHVLVFPYKADGHKNVRIEEHELETLYPRGYRYLQGRKNDLGGRGYFERSSKAWYELWNERSFGKQLVRKIVVQEIAAGAKFALSTAEEVYLDTVCGIVLKDKSDSHNSYILGLLNSKLLEYYYKRTTVPKAGGFYIYKTMFLKPLPIRRIDFDNLEEKQLHDRLVALVDRMLELHRRQADKTLPQSEQEDIGREIARTDREIDDLVYDLYGLTAEERRLVEEGTKG